MGVFKNERYPEYTEEYLKIIEGLKGDKNE